MALAQTLAHSWVVFRGQTCHAMKSGGSHCTNGPIECHTVPLESLPTSQQHDDAILPATADRLQRRPESIRHSVCDP